MGEQGTSKAGHLREQAGGAWLVRGQDGRLYDTLRSLLPRKLAGVMIEAVLQRAALHELLYTIA